MAVHPEQTEAPRPLSRLVPFQPHWAADVVTWVRDDQELYWLAPKSRPPLTAAEVLRWHEPDHDPYSLLDAQTGCPVAYGELNRLAGRRREYWLGHLIVDPARRGQGLGIALTRALLEEAFARRGAWRVTLVVFPENRRALACYRAAGLRDDGHEWHRFPARGREELLVRLAARADDWAGV